MRQAAALVRPADRDLHRRAGIGRPAVKCQTVTQSSPPSGSSRRPSASEANASARAAAGSAPESSTITAHSAGTRPSAASRAFAPGSLPMNSGQASRLVYPVDQVGSLVQAMDGHGRYAVYGRCRTPEQKSEKTNRDRPRAAGRHRGDDGKAPAAVTLRRSARSGPDGRLSSLAAADCLAGQRRAGRWRPGLGAVPVWVSTDHRASTAGGCCGRGGGRSRVGARGRGPGPGAAVTAR